MVGAETALVSNAIWGQASLWSCWGCPFLLKLVNEDNSGGAWAPKRKTYSIDEVQAEKKEGGQCLFWDEVELGLKEDVLQLAGKEDAVTPCGNPYFGLCKSACSITKDGNGQIRV